MAKTARYTVQYRRKLQGKTNYKQRLALIKNRVPRFVVRKTLKHINIQLIEYKPAGDKVILQANTTELKKLGWKASTASTPAAYLCGALLAKKASAKKISQAIADFGNYTSIKGAILYAAIKGANENGLKVPCSDTVYPDDQRIKGTHIAQWAKKLKQENKEKYAAQFSKYIKNGIDPEQITKHFEDTLKKVKGAA